LPEAFRTVTPSPALPRLRLADVSVPMKLPSMRFDRALLPETRTPAPPLAAMTLAAAAVVPPIRFPAQDGDAAGAVAQRLGARDVGADEVARDERAGGGRHEDAVEAVAGDQVAGAGRGTANEVAVAGDQKAGVGRAIGDGMFPGGVRADIVALEYVAAALDLDTEIVPRDDVTGVPVRAADGVV
jgi:hypothetical protein